MIDNVFCADCCGFPESRTLKVGEEVPAVVDAPVMTPFALRLRPIGNEPLARSHVCVPIPPEAVNAKV